MARANRIGSLTDEGERQLGRQGLPATVYAMAPRVLSRMLGPVLRTRRRGGSAFLDRLSQTHEEAMLALPNDHWERLIRALGLVGFRALLDVGCGPGGWLAPLARVNARVVGIDRDDGVLDMARGRLGDAHNVEIRKMPAEKLDFADETFDAVTCFTVLPYLDQPRAIAEMARVLRRDGRLVLGTVGFGYYARHVVEGIRHEQLDAIRYGLDPILVAGGRAIAGAKVAPASLKSWSPRAVRRLLESHGFEVDRVVRDVGAADPSWPKSFLGRPVYFITFATKRPAAPHRFAETAVQEAPRTDASG